MKKDAALESSVTSAGAVGATVSPSSSPGSRTRPSIPDHELLRCIGDGSYGDVWLARNVVGTLRAVKIVRRSTFERDEHFEREFRGIQKFEPVSRSHEGLVDVLQIGRNDEAGYFYYVMELADSVSRFAFRVSSSTPGSTAEAQLGTRNSEPETYVPRTLRAEQQRLKRLPVSECVSIGVTLASALAHLHKHGLVHRDVKPSNIIFVHGVPKLADIGLVADASEARSFVGTIGFIPPEGPGSPQADLYSLGKVLYEISTGKDRHDFPHLPPELLREGSVSAGASPSPSPGPPGERVGVRGHFVESATVSGEGNSDATSLIELNEVLLRACHKDVRQRYASADAMLADLQLLQLGQSVKRKRALERRWRFSKKAAIVAAIGTLAAVGFASIRHWRPQPIDPLTTGKNVGGYPPTAMRGTTNKEAWDHYRLGFFAFRRLTDEGNRQAEEHFNKAIELDSRFALGYWGLWALKFFDTRLLTHAETDEWRRLVDKLAELDSGLAETHLVLGFIRFWEWKWQEAEAEYREALRLNPDCIPAFVTLGFQLSHVGRTDEALQVLDRGLLIDPNTPQLVKMKGHVYFIRRQFQQALNLYLESVRRGPPFPEARRWTARAYFAMTNYPAAIDELERRDLLRGESAPEEAKREYAELRRALNDGGPRGFWLKRLDLSRARWKPEDYPYTFAQIYAWLGDKEQALDWLEKAFERHDELVYLIFDECWDPWRDEPRFEAIRKKIGMPRHPSFPAK